MVPGTVLPFLAAQLRAPEPGVRFRAAYLMAGIGQDARPFADALAGLTADTAAATSHGARTTVSDAGVWALTRIGDPRGIPELASRLKGDRTGFPAVNTSFQWRVGRNAAFTASLPSIGAVVTDADPGARLLDPVIERLRAAADGTEPVLAAILCQTLGAWGPQAAPALIGMIRLPEGNRVLRYLADFGAEAAEAEE